MVPRLTALPGEERTWLRVLFAALFGVLLSAVGASLVVVGANRAIDKAIAAHSASPRF